MNFFEEELRKLFDDEKIIESPSYSGRACLGRLGKDLLVRAQFVTTGIRGDYSALRVKVISRKSDQEIDSLMIRFLDLWGKFYGEEPHIRYDIGTGEAKWYKWGPTERNRDALRQQVHKFLEVYRDHSQDRERETAKVVYICAPLHGFVKENMEFVRQKANEELAAGNIPICPHFLLPPTAKINQVRQVKAAKEMGIKMLESSQEVHVYGDLWTDRMWDEIHHAEQLGIPVRTDPYALRRSAPHRTPKEKGKGGPSR